MSMVKFSSWVLRVFMVTINNKNEKHYSSTTVCVLQGLTSNGPNEDLRLYFGLLFRAS